MKRKFNLCYTKVITKLAKVTNNKVVNKLASKRAQYHANQAVNIAADIFKNGTEEEKAKFLEALESINN